MTTQKKHKSLTQAVRDVTKAARGMDPNVWQSESKIRPDVKEVLLELAKRAWEGLTYDDAELNDVVITGSMTGDRWSEDSDVDLHLMVQFSDSNDDEELVGELYRIRSRVWNQEHDIEVGGHPIEVYVQDMEAPHYSIGVYSLIEDGWLKKEDAGEFAKYDEVLKETKKLASDVKRLISSLKKPSWKKIETASTLMKNLRELRTAGLERAGEGSVENLSYKALRRMGLLEKLNDSTKEGFDQLFN